SPSTIQIYTLSLHDALPILDQVVVVLHRHELRPTALPCDRLRLRELPPVHAARADVARLARADDVAQHLHRLVDRRRRVPAVDLDRKSTRLNSSHDQISYAV